MSVAEHKQAAARAAVEYVSAGDVVGVGTGSTADYFIEALGEIRGRIEGAVASSEATRARLEALSIPVIELNAVGDVPLYVDGADEANPRLELIKGGGGALTREKIIAQAAASFICIVDASKEVETLGAFPLPVEVIPMARSLVARELVRLGGVPEWRDGFTTDNGNAILNVRGLDFTQPPALEARLNQIPGVVTVGLFAARPADRLIVGTDGGVRVKER